MYFYKLDTLQDEAVIQVLAEVAEVAERYRVTGLKNCFRFCAGKATGES